MNNQQPNFAAPVITDPAAGSRSVGEILSQKNSTSCEWIGNGEKCDCATVKGRNYCETHLWRIYAKGTAVRQRPRKEKKHTTAMEICEELRQVHEELNLEGKITV